MIAVVRQSDYTMSAMGKRGLRFCCAFAIRHYVLDLPGIILSLPALWISPSEARHGIRILDPMSETRVQFMRTVGEALDLIANSDPVKFSRLRIQVDTIVNCSGIIAAVYGPALKDCAVNLRYFNCAGDSHSAVQLLASALVHEATAGYLLSQGALRTRRNCERFDRLCRTEAQRFMRRLGVARTPWDSVHPPHVSLGEQLRIWLKDTAAARREGQ